MTTLVCILLLTTIPSIRLFIIEFNEFTNELNISEKIFVVICVFTPVISLLFVYFFYHSLYKD